MDLDGNKHQHRKLEKRQFTESPIKILGTQVFSWDGRQPEAQEFFYALQRSPRHHTVGFNSRGILLTKMEGIREKREGEHRGLVGLPITASISKSLWKNAWSTTWYRRWRTIMITRVNRYAENELGKGSPLSTPLSVAACPHRNTRKPS